MAEVARRHGLWVVEDDVYGALLDRSPLVALLPERGIVVTSLSKTVAAGLRFGLIAGAWPLAPLMAEVACRWIEDGTATRRLAWQRAEVAARHTLARHTLVGTGARAGPPGPHLWLPLAFGADEVAACCRAAGVEVVASPLFAVTREAPKACESASPRPAAAPNWPVRWPGSEPPDRGPSVSPAWAGTDESGSVSRNAGSGAANVGRTPRIGSPNAGRERRSIAGRGAHRCEPLHLPSGAAGR